MAKSSADRSAAAEEKSAAAAERSARAAEEALSIERERFDEERAAQSFATAPRLEIRGKWSLGRTGSFGGILANPGPSDALVERVALECGNTLISFVVADPKWDGTLARGEGSDFQAPWPWGDNLTMPQTVQVVYTATDSGLRLQATFRLIRRNANVMGDPEWAPASPPDVRRLVTPY
jgi:hypothetical protein